MYIECDNKIVGDLKTVLKNKNHLKIIGIEKNLENTVFLVTEYMNAGTIRIMLFNSAYKREHGRNPKLWGSYNQNKAEIDLIEPLVEDQGNEAILQKYFLMVVDQLGIKEVKGPSGKYIDA